MLSSEGLCRCSIILIASIFTSGTIKKSLLSVQNLILSHLKNVSTVLIQGWVRSPPIGHYDLWPVTLCPQGSSVAQLKATDPEGEPLIYGVSGEEAMKYFSVNKDTGVVWLRQQLDREVWGKHKLCLRMQITKANLLQKKKKETAFGGYFENDRRNVNHHMMKGQWMYGLLKEMKRTSEWHFNVCFLFSAWPCQLYADSSSFSNRPSQRCR